jgi:hypothetical protein
VDIVCDLHSFILEDPMRVLIVIIILKDVAVS